LDGPVEHLNMDELPKMPFVLVGVSARFIRENRIIPLELRENVLSVLMADPGNRAAIDALKVAASARVRVFTGDEAKIEEYISRFYGKEAQDFSKIIENIGEGGLEYVREDEEDAERLKDLASEAPIIRLVNLFITRAVESRASDIHIEPYESEIKVRYRIDGILYDIESPPKRLQAAIISRIKIMAKLNIAEKRLPQDGRIEIKIADRSVDIRVSTIPTAFGERVVLRLLDKTASILMLSDLGMDDRKIGIFNGLIQSPYGIVLVTGPTGSGKTTTLYAALSSINQPGVNIITIEDPIEYQIDGIGQIQVNPKIDLTFAQGLRSIVRQDPDVILVGEIRDRETAEIAIQSSLTGHLVFSTLHTNDAASAVTRLIDMGIEPFLVTSSVIAIIAQRLVRVLCPKCKEAYIADDESLANLGVDRRQLEGQTLYRKRGCAACMNTGYHGRTAIFEILVPDETIKRLILKTSDANQIQDAAMKRGMTSLLADGARKVLDGVTTIEEVFRVTRIIRRETDLEA